jgi:hypothetical protein
VTASEDEGGDGDPGGGRGEEEVGPPVSPLSTAFAWSYTLGAMSARPTVSSTFDGTAETAWR